MKTDSLRKKFIFIIILILLTGCQKDNKVKVGHTGGPLLPTLYSAYNTKEWKNGFESLKFGSSGDVGYALLSGEIDAGFVDPATVVYLQKNPGFQNLEAVGKVSFQYGSTVVVSKKLNSHFDKTLEGKRFAVNSENCVLYQTFKRDAESRGIDSSKFKTVITPFHMMVAALESDRVDVIVSRPAYAAVAAGLGHRAIYKNYDVVAGDSCCPVTLEQLALVLLANKKSHDKVQNLVKLLLKTEDSVSRDNLRKSITDTTNIPEETLSKFPLAQFLEADQKLLHIIKNASLEEDEDKSEEHHEETK